MSNPTFTAPEILDFSAANAFEEEAASQNMDVKSIWVGGYVDYEWEHLRHILEAYYDNITGLNILEFGCNFGASSIVLAQMGANVTAVDVDQDYIKLANKNAAQYQLQDKINFLYVEDTQSLPFDNGQFDIVIANSVLEYVPHQILNNVLNEIDRVLKVGGDIQILGTSSRLAPKEVHEGTWLINYIPRVFDRVLFKENIPARGIWPWQLTSTLNNYLNKDYQNNSREYLLARNRIGKSKTHLSLLKIIDLCVRPFQQSVGLFGMNISVALSKSSNK